MSYPSKILITLGLSLGALSGSAAISLDGLTSNSPFVVQSVNGVLPTNPETANIEFRGVIASQNGTIFGLYDRTRNQGSWVRQNEKGAEFNVISYDAANEVVTVDYQGQKLSLALSSAKIGMAAPSTSPVIAAAPLGAPTATASTGPTDQRRLESVAAEVRRRRALRQSIPAAAPAPAGITRP